jgi:endogenous inhibitor of DNA gyrase (YacG/DUF329 family)
MNNKNDLIVDCRLCGKKFSYYQHASRPFCSEKCRLIDLGAWLNESYSIPEKPVMEEPEDQHEE